MFLFSKLTTWLRRLAKPLLSIDEVHLAYLTLGRQVGGGTMVDVGAHNGSSWFPSLAGVGESWPLSPTPSTGSFSKRSHALSTQYMIALILVFHLGPVRVTKG